MRYGVINTSIFSEGGYSVFQIRVFEVESVLVAPSHLQIVENRTEHITSRIPKTVNCCIQKAVEGILRRRRRSVLLPVTFLEERAGTRVGI
jgi:hypothetical protein